MAKGRETIFDQSFATQERIDILLRSLHDICMMPKNVNNMNLYERNIIRLKKEAQTKFSNSERDKCQEYLNVINMLKSKWNTKLYTPGTSQNIALSEFYTVLDSFEDWLYITLDRHGMLMKDKAKETDALRVI